MSETKKSILLVDDHDLILQGIKYIVDQIPEINQLCTASVSYTHLTLPTNSRV